MTLRDEEGYTPLLYAAFYAREQVCGGMWWGGVHEALGAMKGERL